MFIVKDSSGDIYAICSRKDDADAFASAGSVDKKTYIIEEVTSDDIKQL